MHVAPSSQRVAKAADAGVQQKIGSVKLRPRAVSSRQPTRLPMRSSNGCFGLRIQPIDVTCRVVVRLLPILGQGVCERVTQPICLVLPDLFQDRLAKLTEHAAHADMVIGAIAQHRLGRSRRPVSAVASRACSGADRSRGRCEQAVMAGSLLSVPSFVLAACSLRDVTASRL